MMRGDSKAVMLVERLRRRTPGGQVRELGLGPEASADSAPSSLKDTAIS